MTVGVFIVGALGDIATTAIVGAAALARGLIPTTGLVTELEEFRQAGLVPWGALRFGGADVRSGDLVTGARALASREAGLLPPDLVQAVEGELGEASGRIERGFLSGAAAPTVRLADPAVRAWRPSPREAVAAARDQIGRFRAACGADSAVVVNVASTEPRDEEAEALADIPALERRLDEAGRPLPASLLYAVAAQDERCLYVNFTPSCGATPPALDARARRARVVHCGRDGKTGETLLKSALAPLFAGRNFRVLSWAGYNALGNRDGEVLVDPGAKAAKIASKGGTLGAILGPERLGTEHVEIAYVPSLGDWKTAWDHIHFEGFLGVRMALELTWRGADSILAAPLVLDLVRLVERAARAGRTGALVETAAFFKDPIGTAERAFPAQMAMLGALARELEAAEAAATCRT